MLSINKMVYLSKKAYRHFPPNSKQVNVATHTLADPQCHTFLFMGLTGFTSQPLDA